MLELLDHCVFTGWVRICHTRIPQLDLRTLVELALLLKISDIFQMLAAETCQSSKTYFFARIPCIRNPPGDRDKIAGPDFFTVFHDHLMRGGIARLSYARTLVHKVSAPSLQTRARRQDVAIWPRRPRRSSNRIAERRYQRIGPDKVYICNQGVHVDQSQLNGWVVRCLKKPDLGNLSTSASVDNSGPSQPSYRQALALKENISFIDRGNIWYCSSPPMCSHHVPVQ